MPSKTNLLLTGLETLLKAVTLPDGTLPIDRVKAATEIDVAVIRKNPNTQVFSQQTREYDGENAELGSEELFFDVWTKDIRQNAGSSQVTDDDKLTAISQAIREQAGHHSGGPFGAGTDLVRIEPGIRESPDERTYIYRLRLIFNVLWG